MFAGAVWAGCPSEPNALVKEGYSLSPAAAAGLERSLAAKPEDESARLRLLGYLTGAPAPLDATRRLRAENILWLIGHDPDCSLFEYVGASWRIFTKGDTLADPEAFAKAKEAWRRQIEAHPKDEQIKQYAATFLEYGDPRTSETLLRDLKRSRALGSLYADWLLGVSAQDYRTGEPTAADESGSIRDSDEGKRILAALRDGTDAQLAGGFGFRLASAGGILYADGRISWDYTALVRESLNQARALDPDTLDWWAVSTALPARGERPPRVFRVSGTALKPMLRKPVVPEYPAGARAKGIEGSVTIEAVIGPDGAVARAVAKSGPPALLPSALAAVSEWKYGSILMNGRPVFIVTSIAIDYRLQGGVFI
ncbi:MAG: energy transducer TonB [Acidobacteriota bacterium]|nr:energy transducer TonB [Acidobacteriota bacterium]